MSPIMITGSLTFTRLGSLSKAQVSLDKLTELLCDLSEKLHHAVFGHDAFNHEVFAHQPRVWLLASYKQSFALALTLEQFAFFEGKAGRALAFLENAIIHGI